MNIDRIKKGFSLIELSIVIVIIGILVVGITNGIDMYSSFKLQVARNQTRNSIVFRSNDLMLWYESTSESSFSVNGKDVSTPNDNDLISRWRDLNNKVDEGLKNHATENSNKPKYIANAINGLPAVGFGSLTTSSSSRAYLNINLASAYNLNQPKTIFLVLIPIDSSQTMDKYITDTNNCSAQNKILFSVVNKRFNFYAGSSANSANYSIPVNKSYLLSLVQNGSSSFYRINKVSGPIVNLGNNPFTKVIKLGTSCSDLQRPHFPNIKSLISHE